MENRFLKFLEEIASTDWEYGDGTPMAGDARKHLDEFYRIAELEQKLAEAHEELALSIKERIELGGKLSRYQGGVEVERLKVCLFQMQEAAKDTRKQVAREVEKHLLGMHWTIPYHETEAMIDRDEAIFWVRQRYGLEG